MPVKKKQSYIVVYVTVPSNDEAKRIAGSIIEHKLAACVNIVSGVQSFFRWQGTLDCAQESLLIIKTTRAKFLSLSRHVASVHSYEVPEIIALPVIAGNEAYLRWIDDSVGKS
jgi:periplasmic divalent cation tolerance protein